MPEHNLGDAIRRQIATSDASREFGVDIYRILAPEDGDHEYTEPVLGVVAEFPNGGTYADWNIDAWPDGQKLRGPHVSIYDSIEDLEQVSEGVLEHIKEVNAYP